MRCTLVDRVFLTAVLLVGFLAGAALPLEAAHGTTVRKSYRLYVVNDDGCPNATSYGNAMTYCNLGSPPPPRMYVGNVGTTTGSARYVPWQVSFWDSQDDHLGDSLKYCFDYAWVNIPAATHHFLFERESGFCAGTFYGLEREGYADVRFAT